MERILLQGNLEYLVERRWKMVGRKKKVRLMVNY